jgi:ferredoxin-NADP reductase
MISSEPLSLRLRESRPLSATLRHLSFDAADGGLLPTSMPGAHLSLTLAGRLRAFKNSYSIVSRHDERSTYEIIVRRTENSRGGSAFIHDELRVGDVVSTSTPNSQFPIQNLARKHLLIGGGIGITPMLSFLPILRERRQTLELHQVAQATEVSVVERLLSPYAAHDISVHAGRSALKLDDILGRQPLGTHVYCCGPQTLMDAVESAAAARGWPASHVHRENFGAAGGEPFRVRLARSGREVAVGEHETMLEALENAGVPMASLCRGGACGECRTTLLDGTPDHRDHFLTTSEKASCTAVMPCVSRARTPTLTIDL